MKDMSGLDSNDYLESYAKKHNGRLPVTPIPSNKKKCTENKALKIFDKDVKKDEQI